MATHTKVALLSAALLVGLCAADAGAQSAPPPVGPQVGDVAPAFSLPGATRYGVLRDPVSLADYKGKVVVLAFFFKARTKG
jgi:peroxiredoxin Q/BCP